MSAALTTNVDQKLLRTTKFPPEYEVSVDMSKVQLTVIKKWVADEVERILKNEDEIVTEMIFETLDTKHSPDIKSLQISLGGFLEQDAAPFCLKLWKMCISAQDNPQGIPQQLLDAKKAELREEAQAREARLARRREEEAMEAQREVERERERRARPTDWGRGGRAGREYDRRPPPRDYSRSPPRRRERDGDNYYRVPGTTDSYVPSGSRRRDDRRPPPSRRYRDHSPSRSRSRSPPRRRRRSPSSDRLSRSRSRTPPRRRYRDRSRSSHRRPRSRKGGARPRSQHYRPGSRSSRRHDSRSRSRTPPRRRRRSSSHSASPPPKKRSSIAADDLLARNNREMATDKHRLSREPSKEPSKEQKVQGEAENEV